MSTSFGTKFVTQKVTTKMSKLVDNALSLTEKKTEFHFFHFPIFAYCPLCVLQEQPVARAGVLQRHVHAEIQDHRQVLGAYILTSTLTAYLTRALR